MQRIPLIKRLKDPSLLRNLAYVGEWRGSHSGSVFSVKDPATGEEITKVPDMNQRDTKDAIDISKKTFQTWKQTTAKERANILRKWFDLMVLHQDDLASIMTAENGKPTPEAKGEVLYGASYIEWYAEEAKRAYGDIIPSTTKGKKILVTKEPVGVCGLITPWNFPNAMVCRKIGPALAAGCTAVLKPAEDTPLSSLALAELALRAGVPQGVFNVVTTSRANTASVGLELCSNNDVRKISFTGSTPVGRTLMRDSASTVKKISMELGGDAPFIVFDDADVDKAVEGLMLSKYRNSGQTCICANRIYVQSGIYDQFAEKLVKKVQSIRVGNGFESGTQQGPLINEAGMTKVRFLVEDAIQKGAVAATGGKPHSLGGNFFEPTVLLNVTSNMKISETEIFGPVAPLYKFETEQQVIEMANNSLYGLASYFFSKDVSRVFRVAEKLESGMVVANDGVLSSEAAPFGGVKQSGIGREGSKYGLDEYLNIKYLCVGNL